MANIQYFDPGDSEVLSPLIAGLTEGLNKLSEILNLKTVKRTNVTLEKMAWVNDKGSTVVGKLYQAPQGSKLWVPSPAPVIKKNGEVITPTNDHFTIDFVGGSLFFDEGFLMQDGDVITADITCIIPQSTVVDEFTADIQTIEDKVSHVRGWYSNGEALNTAVPTGVSGDFAIVGETNSVWVWDFKNSKWVDTHKGVDLSDYYTMGETDNLLNSKEPTLNAKGTSSTDDNYYYGGRKQWINLLTKVRGTKLDGLKTDSSAAVEASDTVLTAVGKLQAQVSERVSQEDFDAFKDNIPAQNLTWSVVISDSSDYVKTEINPYDIGGEYATVYFNHRFGSDAVFDVIFRKDSFETMKENGVSYVVAETDGESKVRLVFDKKFKANRFDVTMNVYHSSTATGAMRGIAMTVPENLDPLKETVAKNKSDIKELQYRYTEEVTANAIYIRNEAKGWFESDVLTLQGVTAETVIDVLFNHATISALKDSGGSWIVLENSDGVVKAISDAPIFRSVPITASYMRNL